MFQPPEREPQALKRGWMMKDSAKRVNSCPSQKSAKLRVMDEQQTS